MKVAVEQVVVYEHHRDGEYRAEAVLSLRVPAMIVGFSQDSEEQAVTNLKLMLKELGLEFDGLPEFHRAEAVA